MSITATQVKELREKSGAGMMDCKKALSEAKGDMDAAIDWLRTKGLATAAKKSGRIASEGLVAIAISGQKGALVELNAETDFVSRNEEFQDFVRTLAQIALEAEDIDGLNQMEYPGTGRTVQDEVTHKIATIGENMALRRFEKIEVASGIVVPYIHNAAADQVGRIGVLVGLDSQAPAETLQEMGKPLAMHIAATNPASISVDALDKHLIQRERDVLIEQAKASGKSHEIAEKMVEGRMRKFYEEVVLLEQIFVIDGESKVKDVIEKAAKAAGHAITLTSFAHFILGEGIEKEQSDFAADVAAQLQG